MDLTHLQVMPRSPSASVFAACGVQLHISLRAQVVAESWAQVSTWQSLSAHLSAVCQLWSRRVAALWVSATRELLWVDPDSSCERLKLGPCPHWELLGKVHRFARGVDFKRYLSFLVLSR